MVWSNRGYAVKVHGFKYQIVSTVADMCIYCGEQANVYDHVPAISLASLYFGDFLRVPSCRECNAFLSALPACKLSIRRKHIVNRILKRRKKDLNIPCWGDEIHEIKGWVNKYIKTGLKKQKKLLRRIKYMQNNMGEEFGDYVCFYAGAYERGSFVELDENQEKVVPARSHAS